MKRKVIPFGITPRSYLLTADGSQWVITLWDLSRPGLAWARGMVNFQAPLMGFSYDSLQTYLAMKFELPTELPPGIFLERYIKANFDV